MKKLLVRAISLMSLCLTGCLYAQNTVTEYIPCDGSSLNPGEASRYCRLNVAGVIQSVNQVYEFPPMWQSDLQPNDCYPGNAGQGARGNYSFDNRGVYAWGGCNGGFVVTVRAPTVQSITKNVYCPTPGYPNVDQVYNNQHYFTCPMQLAHNNNVIVPNSMRVSLIADYSPGHCTAQQMSPAFPQGSWNANVVNKTVTVYNRCYAGFAVKYQIRIP